MYFKSSDLKLSGDPQYIPSPSDCSSYLYSVILQLAHREQVLLVEIINVCWETQAVQPTAKNIHIQDHILNK